MSAKVYKLDSAVTVSTFSIPNISERFDYEESADSEVFITSEAEETEQTEQTADELLQNVREEAAQIIVQAEKDKEMIELAAREKAEQEARATVELEIAEKVNEIRVEFAETLQQLDALRDEISIRTEKDVVELALEIAKKIIGREVMFDREIALTLVKVSLKKIHGRSLAQVHLHPEDFIYVQTQRERLDFRGSLEFIEDRSISLGGCLIHTETGDVDATIESQFAEISHGLLGK